MSRAERPGAPALLLIGCLLAAALAPRAGLGREAAAPDPSGPRQAATVFPTPELWGVEVLSVHPHDRGAHTQGLVFGGGGLLLESEGKEYPDGSGGTLKRSSLRKVELTTGRVLDKVDRTDVWAEGLALVGAELIQLTFREGQAIVYDRDSLAEVRRMPYSGEGWGLCFDGSRLWMSDGSARLTRRDPQTFAQLGALDVVSGTAPLADLNALHCAGDTILANLFPSRPESPRERIAVVDAPTGRVRAIIDARGLLTGEDAVGSADMNGIAQIGDGSLVLTGKLWPKLFRVRVRAGPTLQVTPTETPRPSPTASTTPTAGRRAAHFLPWIVAIYPRDPGCFTQGLELQNGRLFDSCGVTHESRVREMDLDSGRPIRERTLEGNDFGEGLTAMGDKLYQLTWRNGKVLVYDRDTLAPLATVPLATEGWGLCFDGASMVVSDGTDELFFYEPETFRLRRTVPVRLDGWPVFLLNELECVGTEIWANVWGEWRVMRIEAATGRVSGVIHAESLGPVVVPEPTMGAVLNGIAHDKRDGTILLTGKRWDRMFRVRLRGAEPAYLPLLAARY